MQEMQEMPSSIPGSGRSPGEGKWKVKGKSLRPRGLQPTRLLRPWDFPGKSTGVGLWTRKYLIQLFAFYSDFVQWGNLGRLHTVHGVGKSQTGLSTQSATVRERCASYLRDLKRRTNGTCWYVRVSSFVLADIKNLRKPKLHHFFSC